VSVAVAEGPAGLAALHARVAGRFARPEVRARGRRYLGGRLGRVERKNGWRLAEALGREGRRVGVAEGRRRWASTEKRGRSECRAALASTLVPSMYRSRPQTNPAAWQRSTMASKKRRNTSRP
jgi:hypothetical protein